MQVLEQQPRHFLALCLAAQAQADGAHHEAALELCRRAAQVDAFSPVSYQLMAQIEEDRGQWNEAKMWWKKVIYLAPSLVWPYLEMETLYRREGDRIRAETMRRAAFKVLASMPPEAPLADAALPVYARKRQKFTVQQLVEHMQRSS